LKVKTAGFLLWKSGGFFGYPTGVTPIVAAKMIAAAKAATKIIKARMAPPFFFNWV